MKRSKRRTAYIFLAFALACNIAFWMYSHKKQAVWGNVPPVPSQETASFSALGDPQFAYRTTGIMLQNLGDTGGHSTLLKNYNYVDLGAWFFLQDKLDPVSDFTPMLAAYYFGATQEKEDLTPVIDYLAMAGQKPYKQKWRWLAQAVYLARYGQRDMEKSLKWANVLANLQTEEELPPWARHMRSFVLVDQGNKAAAYELMIKLLKDKGDQLPPNEVHFMVDYICHQLLDKEEVKTHPLCINVK